jgi:molecular chaperone DnaK (HSP70)
MHGDTTLGGVDFVKRMIDYCVFEFKETTGELIPDSSLALEKLRE